MGLQAPTSPTLFAFLIIYAAVGVTLLGLAGKMCSPGEANCVTRLSSRGARDRPHCCGVWAFGSRGGRGVFFEKKSLTASLRRQHAGHCKHDLRRLSEHIQPFLLHELVCLLQRDQCERDAGARSASLRRDYGRECMVSWSQKDGAGVFFFFFVDRDFGSGILWVWEAACAVAITAAAIAVAGSLVGLLWLVLVPQSDRTCAVLRGLVVFSEVAPIIFGGIAGVLLCVTAVQIVITNGYFGSTVIPFYVQTAVAASMAWLLTVLGFALCTPTARLGREDL